MNLWWSHEINYRLRWSCEPYVVGRRLRFLLLGFCSGPTPRELEEKRWLEEELRQKKEEEEMLEQQRRDEEEAKERKRRQEEWVNMTAYASSIGCLCDCLVVYMSV